MEIWKKIFCCTRSAVLAAVTLFCCSGCEILQEAMDAGALDTDNPNSEDYRPRFVVGIFSIVYYPRASELEKPVRDLSGREIYINTNQNFSSKNLRDVKIVVRPGNPELCDLKLRLDRRGKVQWQLLAGRHRDEQVAFVVDGKLLAKFVPELPEDENANWVFVRVGIDHFHAKNIVKFAKKNYIFYNPDSSNFFKSF
ncbi:MAG: hypothetical protein IKA87_04455 [Lentisphaeria bacterium]|nr:hypothetical protein [Lentisphaeria bacterium]